MKYCRKLILLFSLLIFSFFSFSQQNEYINANEKILFNAKIFTANTVQPWAEAIAIHGNKIIAVGNFDEVKKTVSASASLINMNGQTLLPGFIDSHSHSLDGGAGMLRANVNDSIFQIADLAKYAEQVRKDGTGMMENFLVIDGLNISTWSHINELSNIFNNGIYTNIPVFLRGSDGHTEWANKLVLQTAGLTKGFLNNLAAESKKYYGVNENGEPNGFVADSGFDKIDAILPADNTDWDKAAIKAMEYNNGYGITAWLEPAAGDISDTKNIYLEEYKKLSQQNKLTAHVAVVIVADANGDATAQINKLKLLQQKYKGIKNLSLLGFKIFADGVVEYPTQTAAMSIPYTNSESKGALMFDPKKFANFATLADKAKLLVHVHAIGDLAVSEALNGFQAARRAIVKKPAHPTV